MAHLATEQSLHTHGAVLAGCRQVVPVMHSSFSSRLVRRSANSSLLLAGLVVASAVLMPATARADDPGRYCLRSWPNDRDSFLLCQQLQGRNHLQFRTFLSEHGIDEQKLEQGRVPDNPAARTAKYCLDRWSPDYQAIWGCTKRRASAGQ